MSLKPIDDVCRGTEIHILRKLPLAIGEIMIVRHLSERLCKQQLNSSINSFSFNGFSISHLVCRTVSIHIFLSSKQSEFDISQIALFTLNLGEIQDNNECGKAPGKQLD